MNTDKWIYWITLGVLALSFNHAAVNRSAANRVEAVVDRISKQLAEKTDRMSAVAFDRGFANFEKSQTKLACAQSRFSSLQATMARHQADFARLQAQRAQLVVIQQGRHISIACPRVKVSGVSNVEIPKLSFVSSSVTF